MRRVICICSLIGIFLISSGCAKFNSVLEETYTGKGEEFIQDNKPNDKKAELFMETEPITEEDVEKSYVIQSNIVEPESTIVFEKVEYKVGKIEVTKQIGDRDKNEFFQLGQETDEVGNITNNKSYAFVHVTIKNKDTSDKDIYIGTTLTVSTIEEDNSVINISCEPAYINPIQNKNDHHKKRLFTLESEKTYEIDIAFLLEDGTINKNLYFQIGASGVEGVLDPNSRFIQVGANGK